MRIGGQLGGQRGVEETASVGGDQVDLAPGQVRGARRGLEEGVAQDLRREDGGGSDHQTQHDHGGLAGSPHRFSQSQPGQ